MQGHGYSGGGGGSGVYTLGPGVNVAIHWDKITNSMKNLGNKFYAISHTIDGAENADGCPACGAPEHLMFDAALCGQCGWEDS